MNNEEMINQEINLNDLEEVNGGVKKGGCIWPPIFWPPILWPPIIKEMKEETNQELSTDELKDVAGGLVRDQQDNGYIIAKEGTKLSGGGMSNDKIESKRRQLRKAGDDRSGLNDGKDMSFSHNPEW